MIKFLLIFIFTINVYAGDFLSAKGAAGDMLHFTGSALGTLALQKTFELEWSEAAGIMFILGSAWEISDAIWGNKVSFFDPMGFDNNDIYRDLLGIALSYPLRYKSFKVGYYQNKVNISYAF